MATVAVAGGGRLSEAVGPAGPSLAISHPTIPPTAAIRPRLVSASAEGRRLVRSIMFSAT
jgi:hypothetical protein